MLRGTTRSALSVRGIDSAVGSGAHSVGAEVEGRRLWFESPDAELSASPEAFACALLVAALDAGRALEIDRPVSARWLSQADPLLDVLYEWWGYPRLRPRAAARPDGPPQSRATALCFSGGVDSFYSLLRSGHPVDLLVTVHGYDIKLSDEGRAAAASESLRAVAAARGARPVLVRTNLREHPAFAGAPWERTHGGALAAVGHLLGGAAGRLLVSSSHPYQKDRPWGSHWRTDALWSSDRLEVVHVGAELPRSEKLRAVAGEPLVRRHLRVCWENLSAEGNCSRCEKCLRTRLLLAEMGELENFPVFEGHDTLAARLDALPALRGRGAVFVRLLEGGRLSPEVARAVRGLLGRTRRARSFPSRLARHTLGRAYAWAQNRLR